MDFGRIHNFEEVNYQLPSLIYSSLIKTKDNKKLFLGCPVWNDPGFKGKIYPPDCSPSDFLYHYSRQFNAIEFNSSFYATPSKENIKKWDEQTPSHFKFCFKFPKFISHNENLGSNRHVIKEFLDAVELLENKVGVLWLQLPPQFSPDSFELLHKFIRCYQRPIPLAIELRHPDWFSENSYLEKVFDVFSTHQTTFILTDTSGRRDVLHPYVSSDKIFIRFTGNSLHQTDYERIDQWISSIQKSFEYINECYFFFHQPQEHLGVELAQYFLEKFTFEVQQKPKLKMYQEKQQSFFE